MSRTKTPGVEKKAPVSSEDDYAPKTYTVQQQIIFGIKMFGIVGLVLLVIWFFDKM